MTAAFPPHENETAPSHVEPRRPLWVAARAAGGLLAALLLAAIVLLMTHSRKAPLAGLAQARLADGSWASVVQVTVGKRHEWQPPDTRTALDWALGRPRLRRVTAEFSFPDLEEHLVIWLVRHDGRTAHPLPWPDLRHARLDVAGERLYPDFVCVHREEPRDGRWSAYNGKLPIPPSLYVGSPGTGPPVTEASTYALAFPKPPAGCGSMILELVGSPVTAGGSSAPLAKVTLAEPAGLGPKATGIAAPPPVTATVGAYALTITAISATNNADKTTDEFRQNCQYVPHVELTEHGVAVPTRLIDVGPVTDAAGNIHRQLFFPGLRPVFPPHRLQLRAVVPPPHSLRADSVMEVADLAIPADNARVDTALQRSLRGDRIRFLTAVIGGRGHVRHQVPKLASGRLRSLSTTVDRERVEVQELHVISRGGTPAPAEIWIDGQVVHLLYDVAGLTSDEVAQVTAVVDDQGRPVPFTDTRFRNLRLLFLKPEPDAQAFRLRCELLDTARFEFLIDPPAAPTPHPGNPQPP